MTTSQQLSLSSCILDQRLDFERDFDTKDNLHSCLFPPFTATTCYLYKFSRRKASKATTQYFLFISIYWGDHVRITRTFVYHNVSPPFLSINLLKLFLRFILLLSGSLYVGGYRSHICFCAEIFLNYFLLKYLLIICCWNICESLKTNFNSKRLNWRMLNLVVEQYCVKEYF